MEEHNERALDSLLQLAVIAQNQHMNKRRRIYHCANHPDDDRLLREK